MLLQHPLYNYLHAYYVIKQFLLKNILNSGSRYRQEFSERKMWRNSPKFCKTLLKLSRLSDDDVDFDRRKYFLRY